MNTLQAVSTAVDLLQLLTSGMAEYQKVSEIIGRRIAEGRSTWTTDEMLALDAAMIQARDAALASVEKLP